MRIGSKRLSNSALASNKVEEGEEPAFPKARLTKDTVLPLAEGILLDDGLDGGLEAAGTVRLEA